MCSWAARASFWPFYASNMLNIFARRDGGIGALTIALMSSDLIISLSASGSLVKVHALQDGILSIFGPNAQHSLLQSLVAQLLACILEHIELQRSQILRHIIAGQTNPTDGIGWIHDPAVEGRYGRHDLRSRGDRP